jgi:hypothetical protein
LRGISTRHSRTHLLPPHIPIPLSSKAGGQLGIALTINNQFLNRKRCPFSLSMNDTEALKASMKMLSMVNHKGRKVHKSRLKSYAKEWDLRWGRLRIRKYLFQKWTN